MLGGALPKLRILCPKTAFFGPKRPQNPQNGQMKGNGCYTPRAPGLPVTNSPLLPSNSTICPRNGPKMAENGPDCAQFVSNSPNMENGLYLGLRGSNPNSEGTYSTRNPPLLVVSKPRNRPTRHLDPRTSGHLVEPEGSAARARWGPTVGPKGSPGRKKSFFLKLPLGMPEQVFSACFEPVVTRFGPWKMPKCLENGLFWDQKWVKNTFFQN